MTHPARACTDPHLLCPQHDHPFYPRHATHQEETPMNDIDIDNAIRRQSEAVREDRTQRNNDQRLAEGLLPLHCGVEVKTISHGDFECRRCGAIF